MIVRRLSLFPFHQFRPFSSTTNVIFCITSASIFGFHNKLENFVSQRFVLGNGRRAGPPVTIHPATVPAPRSIFDAAQVVTPAARAHTRSSWSTSRVETLGSINVRDASACREKRAAGQSTVLSRLARTLSNVLGIAVLFAPTLTPALLGRWRQEGRTSRNCPARMQGSVTLTETSGLCPLTFAPSASVKLAISAAVLFKRVAVPNRGFR
uniref:Uncharacterized protein n=1 Tax=Biomphalaria glabrata TaxID=6526 RepID=A0A2C9LPQ9_BIOGL